jgi:flavin reductase (DIM6/NTAB) family NADH-FMN oxidoreductase RutF
MKHKKVNIDTLYYGFPVFLLSTIDEKGITNIAPISSSWALGENIIIGVGTDSKSYENLKAVPEAVLNLPDEGMHKNIEKIAPYTGKKIIESKKTAMGYSYLEDKFLKGGFNAEKSTDVKPDKIKECPVQIEVRVKNIMPRDWFAIVELEVLSVYAFESIVTEGLFISPDKWKPLIYNFRKYYGLCKSIGKNFRFKSK